MNTREFAAKIGKQQQTLRASYCRTGSYLGVVPQKLPDGSLVWPDDALEQLIDRANREGVRNKTAAATAARSAKYVQAGGKK